MPELLGFVTAEHDSNLKGNVCNNMCLCLCFPLTRLNIYSNASRYNVCKAKYLTGKVTPFYDIVQSYLHDFLSLHVPYVNCIFPSVKPACEKRNREKKMCAVHTVRFNTMCLLRFLNKPDFYHKFCGCSSNQGSWKISSKCIINCLRYNFASVP